MLLETSRGAFQVEASMSGRLEPVDGRCHWSGRIEPRAEVAALVRAGIREATLDGVPVRLTEIDPWGGVLVRGVKA